MYICTHTYIYEFNRLYVTVCICVCISNKTQNKLVTLILFFVEEKFPGLSKNANSFIVYTLLRYIFNFLILISSK